MGVLYWVLGIFTILTSPLSVMASVSSTPCANIVQQTNNITSELKDVALSQFYEAKQDVLNAKQTLVLSKQAQTLFGQLQQSNNGVDLTKANAFFVNFKSRFENDVENAEQGVLMSKQILTLFTQLKSQIDKERKECQCLPTRNPKKVVVPTKKLKDVVASTKKRIALAMSTRKPVKAVASTKKPVKASVPTKKPVKAVAPTKKPVKAVVPPKTRVAVVMSTTKHNVVMMPAKKPVKAIRIPVKAVAVSKKPVKVVVPKKAMPVVVAPKKAMPVVVAPRKAMPVIAAPKKAMAVVVAPRKPVAVVVAPRKPVAVVVAPKKTVVVAPKKPVAIAVAPKKPVAVVAAPRKPVAVVAAPKKPVAVIRMPFTFATATASGDPHTDTFDGPHHDTMISGWFTYAKNDIVNIQGLTQLGCMPPSIPNTCLRSIVVRITLPDGKSLTVSWGSWPPAGRAGDQNVVIVDSSGKNINTPAHSYRATTFLDLYKIEMRNGNLVLSPLPSAVADPEKAVSITIGTYFLAVTLPKAAPHLGHTNGLFGFFNGKKDYNSVFRNKDGSASRITTKSLCQRGVGQCGWASQQKPEIVQWAMTHATSTPNVSPNPLARRLVSIGSSHFVLPGFVPKVTTKKLLFCKNMLSRVKIAKKKYPAQLNSCLQDADSPSVARSIAKVIRVARVQQKKAKRALRRVVKQRARKAQKLRLRQLREKLSTINAKSAKKAADTQNIVTIQMNFR